MRPLNTVCDQLLLKGMEISQAHYCDIEMTYCSKTIPVFQERSEVEALWLPFLITSFPSSARGAVGFSWSLQDACRQLQAAGIASTLLPVFRNCCTTTSFWINRVFSYVCEHCSHLTLLLRSSSSS